MTSLTDLVYLQGKILYHDKDFAQARKYFQCVPKYMDSKDYITLLDARKDSEKLNAESMTQRLMDLFYFEDASDIILKSEEYLQEYLMGKWSGGRYYFTMEKNSTNSTSYNLPWIDDKGFQYYSIDKGIFYLEGENERKPQFKFILLTPDSMQVYCYKNGSTYTLYRQ